MQEVNISKPAPQSPPVESMIATPPPGSLPTPPGIDTAGNSASTYLRIRAASEAFHSATNAYEQLQALLQKVTYPDEHGISRLTLKNTSSNYEIVHDSKKGDIEVKVSSLSASGRSWNLANPASLKFQANGAITFHPTSSEGRLTRSRAAMYHSKNILGLLQDYSNNATESWKAFERLHHQLTQLKGRFNPKDSAVWYEHFVARKGKVYSFKISNLNLKDVTPNPSLYQITVYEDTPQGRQLVFTSSQTGEKNYRAPVGMKNYLSIADLELVRTFNVALHNAIEDPKSYEIGLQKRLQDIRSPWFREVKIETSMVLPDAPPILTGPQGATILNIESGWKLWKLIRPFNSGERWTNPYQISESRPIRPDWNLRRAMYLELMRWIGRSSFYGGFMDISNPKPTPDAIRLHLNPDGSGQLNIYRNGKLHDIVVSQSHGDAISLDKLILQRSKNDAEFSKLAREKQIETTSQSLSSQDKVGVTFEVRDIPAISSTDIENLFSSNLANSLTNKYQSATTVTIKVWERILNLPQLQNLKRHEHFTDRTRGLKTLEPFTIDLIEADFPESRTPLSVRVATYEIEGIKYTEIVVRHGETFLGTFLEDGKVSQQPSIQKHQMVNRAAMEGHVNRGVSLLVGQNMLRFYNYARINGAAYGFGYFFSLPLVKTFEEFYYSSAEKKQIGTPWPELSLQNIWNQWWGFLAMVGASGSTTVVIDGLFNYGYGLAQVISAKTGGESFFQAFRHHSPSFFNPKPILRPVANHFLVEGLLKRSLPLLAGLMALEKYEHGEIDSDKLWKQFRNISIVSFASSGILQLMLRSATLTKLGERVGLLEASVSSSSRLRHALTFRGTLLTVGMELLAINLIDAVDRKSQFEKMEQRLRAMVGRSLYHRNELMTYIEEKIEVSPYELFLADVNLQQAVSQYQQWLDSAQYPSMGKFSSIDLHTDAEERLKRYRKNNEDLLGFSESMKKSYQLSLDLEHQSELAKVQEEKQARHRIEKSMYRQLGIELPEQLSHEKLRDFVSNLKDFFKAHPELLQDEKTQKEILDTFSQTEELKQTTWQSKDWETFYEIQETMDQKYLAHSKIFAELQENLAPNGPDFQRQMEDYYQRSNERMAAALQAFLEEDSTDVKEEK